VLRKEDISVDLTNKLSVQNYALGKAIEGVRLIEFDFHVDDGGDFHEIARIKNGVISSLEDFELKQINRSRFNPGLIKAFHLHFKQDEVWAVKPLDRMLVGLLDTRRGSKTEGAQMRFILGGGKSRLLYIPRGVAHGGAVLGRRPVDVLYLVNENFSSTDPDEWRLPWNLLGEEFWQVNRA